MNIINCLLLLNYISFILASCSPSIMQYNYIKKLKYKYIIFKKKEYPKILDNLKNRYQIYYGKSINVISEFLNEYDKLSSEDKVILDFIISSIL
jgi:hypothetical protein